MLDDDGYDAALAGAAARATAFLDGVGEPTGAVTRSRGDATPMEVVD